MPARTSATTASAALARLKSPGSRVEHETDTPPGPSSSKVLPCGPMSAAATRQSASPPTVETVTTGTVASPASRAPYSSSTSTTADRECSGVKSTAFAAK